MGQNYNIFLNRPNFSFTLFQSSKKIVIFASETHKYVDIMRPQTIIPLSLLALAISIIVSCSGKAPSREELDSIRTAKKLQYWDQKLLLVQRDLERTDSMLHAPAVDSTKVDSLKERFDMLCMQIRFIHRKQKQQ